MESFRVCQGYSKEVVSYLMSSEDIGFNQVNGPGGSVFVALKKEAKDLLRIAEFYDEKQFDEGNIESDVLDFIKNQLHDLQEGIENFESACLSGNEVMLYMASLQIKKSFVLLIGLNPRVIPLNLYDELSTLKEKIDDFSGDLGEGIEFQTRWKMIFVNKIRSYIQECIKESGTLGIEVFAKKLIDSLREDDSSQAPPM